MNFIQKIFKIKHKCEFNENDVLLDCYKNSLKNIYKTQGKTLLKDFDSTPKCVHCGKKLPEQQK